MQGKDAKLGTASAASTGARQALLIVRLMKREQDMLTQPPSSLHSLEVENVPALPPAAPTWLPRLTLGGAIGGSFVGSFAGALLGVAIGAVYRDISLGLDGALLGSAVAAAAGAVYGFLVARREKRNPTLPHEERPHP